MSVDYLNYREWKEVELYGEEVQLNNYTEYKIDELTELFKSLLEKASKAGLENCYLKFESRHIPREDWLGDPVVFPCGYRKLNTKELKEMERQDYITKLAKEKGITEYEAKNLLNLVEKRIVKL